MSTTESQLLLSLHNYYFQNLFAHLGHFPGGPGLVDATMFPFWILSELRMMEVVATAAAIRRTMLQSNRHHQHTSTQFVTGQIHFLSLN